MPRWVRKVVEADNNLSVEEHEEVVAEVETKITKSTSRPYRVFDNRAGLVAQVNSIEEAEEEVKRFPGGTYRMI